MELDRRFLPVIANQRAVLMTILMAGLLVSLDYLELKGKFISDQVAFHHGLYREFVQDRAFLPDEHVAEGEVIFETTSKFIKTGDMAMVMRLMWSVETVRKLMLANERSLNFQLRSSLLDDSETELTQSRYREFHLSVYEGLTALSSPKYLITNAAKLFGLTCFVTMLAGGLVNRLSLSGVKGRVLTWLVQPQVLLMLIYLGAST